MKTTTLIPALVAALALPAPALVVSYSYDAAGRLRGVNYGGMSNTAYSYDANGNLLVRANTTNPLPPLAATYAGLVTNAAPVAGNEGFITLKLDAGGKFTGKITIGGVSKGFGGTFAQDGSTPYIMITGTNLTLSLLVLDVSGGTQRITAKLSDGVFTSDVTLERERLTKKRTRCAAASSVRLPRSFKKCRAATAATVWSPWARTGR